MRRSRRCNRLPPLPSRLVPPPTIPSYIDSALVAARSKMPPAEAVKQMARDMQDAYAREGGLTEGALKLLGYTAQQIAAHADDARVLADQQAGAR